MWTSGWSQEDPRFLKRRGAFPPRDGVGEWEVARSPPGGAAAAWARGPPEAWFLSFGRWEDKRTAMAYAKDFHDPRVLGDLLLPWRGEGETLEFRGLGASQVWAGVQFATERLGGPVIVYKILK